MPDNLTVFSTCLDGRCGGYLRWHGRQHDNTHEGCVNAYQAERDLAAQFLTAVEAGQDAEADRLAYQMDEPLRTPPRLAEAALVYAEDYGWKVFPLLPGKKTPATKHGVNDATSNADTIRAWWRRMPHANIGLATGHTFDVIDIDYRVPGTWERALKLKDSPTLVPIHGIVCTASGGEHLYRQPSGAGNTANAVPGIDYRGKGGYVVAPPSRRADGRDWEWTCHPSPFIKPTATPEYKPDGVW